MDNTNKLFRENLEFIIAATGIGLWDWELDTGHVIYSPEWEAIAGYAPGELPQSVNSWINLVLAEDMPDVDAIIDRVMAGETSYYQSEFRLRRKDGSIIWAQDKGIVTERHDDGKPRRIVGVLQDVTRLKQVENELDNTSKQLELIAKICGLSFWEWDMAKNHIYYRKNHLEMLGYDPNEITGSLEEWRSLVHPDDLDRTD
ncbi:MAG: PAS domain-containing protein, partial [Acidobacteriota bacterium]|nr:PAS domain-containing protein [Acidobacteriota bacterium]